MPNQCGAAWPLESARALTYSGNIMSQYQFTVSVKTSYLPEQSDPERRQYAFAYTLTIRNTGGELAAIEFDVAGSVTGPDGSGKVGERFVSNSKRIALDPEDWNLEFCRKAFGPHLKDGTAVKWRAEFHGVDQFSGRQTFRGGDEQVETLAQGLTNGPHRLELSGNLAAATALRIYRPPLDPAAK